MRYLFRLYPELKAKIPFLPLGEFPTPISGPFAFGVHTLWVKRDDLASPLHGGNKVRKLELLLALAKEKGEKHLAVGGAEGSNWCVATAIFGSQQGFSLQAHLFPQPSSPWRDRNLKVVQKICKVKLHPHPLFLLFARAKQELFLPLGGTSPLSSLGYADAALELIFQIKEQGLPWPDEIWLPLGTGGTVAGLLLGLSLGGVRIPLCAVRVVDILIANRYQVQRLVFQAKRILCRFASSVSFSPLSPLRIYHSAFCPGYAIPSSLALWGIQEFQKLTGLSLEPTYTGKTAGLLLAKLKAEKNPKHVLFWNTYNSRPLPF